MTDKKDKGFWRNLAEVGALIVSPPIYVLYKIKEWGQSKKPETPPADPPEEK